MRCRSNRCPGLTASWLDAARGHDDSWNDTANGRHLLHRELIVRPDVAPAFTLAGLHGVLPTGCMPPFTITTTRSQTHDHEITTHDHERRTLRSIARRRH